VIEGWNYLSVILHHWYSDPQFSRSPGHPLTLPFSSAFPSFVDLVKRYGGDLPPGAVRAELRRAGAIIEDSRGMLTPSRRWYAPTQVDQAFLESMAFSLSNLTETMNHNIALAADGLLHGPSGRVERYVWTSEISETDKAAFKVLSETRAVALLEELDEWVAERERHFSMDQPNTQSRTFSEGGIVGLGFYYFETRGSEDH
jgi:hypothetical protein